VLLGLVVGLGGAFLLEFIDTSVKSPSDISRRVELPVLGMVPHLDDMDEELEDLRLAFRTHPNSLVGEAFRQIRTCLLFSGPASQRRSLLITSPLPGDGRTAVTLNLAAAMARGGRRVLVVDANFRQPAVSQIFPDAPADGLSSAVVGRTNWTDCVYEVEENFHVMPAGHMPPNPAELLGSDEMRQLLSEMENEYDQVLLDSAPCLVVTDPCVLGSLADGVVLVVRAGANTYGIVQRTRDMLARVGARMLGVALNGVRATAGGYFRSSYETFYEYHQPQQLPES
jgi:capsular exopolysaccharide synthesis family protein